MRPTFLFRELPFAFLTVILSSLLAAQETPSWLEEEFTAARNAEIQGRYLEAVAHYESILQRDPQLAEAYNNQGLDFYRLKEYERTATVLVKALNIKPEMLSAHLFLGLADFKLGHFAQSTEQLQAVLNADPRNNEAYIFLIQAQMGLGRFDIDLAQRALELFPKDAEVNYVVGLAALERIREIADYANQLGPKSPIFHWMRLRLDEQKNDLPSIAKHREEIQKLGVITPPPIIREYDALASLVDRSFKAVVETAPNSTYSHRVQGHIDESKGLSAEALDEYRKAQDHFSAGRLLAQDFHLVEAAAELEAALAAEPENRLAAAELAQVYVQDHKADKAVPLLEGLLKNYPQDAYAWADVGRTEIMAGQVEQGIRSLRTALRLNPSLNNVHYELAMAYRKLGQARLAEEEIKTFQSRQNRTP
jgi:tetratricopeptide (TPR) repeat protein